MSEKPDKTFEDALGDVWDEIVSRDEPEPEEEAPDEAADSVEETTPETTTEVGGDDPGGTETGETTDTEADTEDPSPGEDGTEDRTEDRQEEPVEVDVPGHWNFHGEEKEAWSKLSPELREFMVERDKKFQTNAERSQQKVARIVRAIDPIRDELAKTGVSDDQAVRNLVAAHVNLMNPDTQARDNPATSGALRDDSR